MNSRVLCCERSASISVSFTTLTHYTAHDQRKVDRSQFSTQGGPQRL